jgi:hypothetical protein
MFKNFGTAGGRKLIVGGRIGTPAQQVALGVGPKFSNGVRLIIDFQRVVAGSSCLVGRWALARSVECTPGRTDMNRNGTDVNNFRTAVVRSSYLVNQQVSDGRVGRTSLAK